MSQLLPLNTSANANEAAAAEHLHTMAPNVPPLIQFPTIVPDDTGIRLRQAMVWADLSPEETRGVAAAFRRQFHLNQADAGKVTMSVFADVRYILWVNGAYVDRGPGRFQPNGPQYDVIDLTPHVRAGTNTIAILVIGRVSGGKVMLNEPGLCAIVDAPSGEVLRTDESWRYTKTVRYQKVAASWANLEAGLIDGRIEDGDWTQPSYNDSSWKAASRRDPANWGPMTRSITPQLAEKKIPGRFRNNVSLPVTLKPGEKLTLDAGRFVQAYPDIEIEASDGAELVVEQFETVYRARAGRQSFFTLDTRGLSEVTLQVKSGQITIHRMILVERLYPFTRIGSFNSSDPLLDRIWQMCARSCEVLSEDSYVDCADRERVEWMDDTPPGFDITRVAMAGPGVNGKLVYSDPRLLAALIRRTALTVQPDGWVKAHTCSDRYDIHAKMEDRACAWIEGQREYVDATGDLSILRETWPAVVAQLDYFLARRTTRGLVRARDWVVWGNPVGYLTGEGTTLNVFVQRALADAAHLGQLIGKQQDAERFAKAARELRDAINTVLWDESSGAYQSGYFTDEDVEQNSRARHKLNLRLTNGLTEPTFHSNVFALDRGIVPPDRIERVRNRMLEQSKSYRDRHIMVWYYVFKQMYALDRPELDQQIVSMFREKWKPMAEHPWDCSWEGFDFGSHAHIYGMYPGYFLSSYVLGVRRDGPVSNKQLIVEPHLADLVHASGTVSTEFGPVPVSWKRIDGRLEWSIGVPPGVRATLKLPRPAYLPDVVANGRTVTPEASGNRLIIELVTGENTGAMNGKR